MATILLRTVIALGLLMAPATLRAEGVLARIATSGTVTAAAVPDQLPASAYDAGGQLTGFDIDVSREIARRLGAGITFVTPAWETILSGRWDGGFDFCACSVTPTKDRAQRLAFPAAYRFDAAVLVVRADQPAIRFAADASGKRISVKADTTFQQYLQRNLVIFDGAPVSYRIDKPVIVPFPDKEDALAAVAAGKVDATITALVTARGAIAAGAPLRIVPGFLFFEPVAVAVAKGDDAFSQRVADVVQRMHEDGTLTKLSVTWFGIDLTRVLE